MQYTAVVQAKKTTYEIMAMCGPRTVFAWLMCALLSLALLHLLCCSPHGAPVLQYIASTYNQAVSSTPRPSCDYSEGQWVSAPGHARRYNGTECNVKNSQNCIRNGRPDTGYLDWRWQPSAAGCQLLPDFDAGKFLVAVRGKHVAFFGDSMARTRPSPSSASSAHPSLTAFCTRTRSTCSCAGRSRRIT